MADQQRWTHDDLKSLLELGVIGDLEKLIAEPGRKYRQELANRTTIRALHNLAESDVLRDDIRALVVRILKLHEQATDPFLGMNLSTTEEGKTQS